MEKNIQGGILGLVVGGFTFAALTLLWLILFKPSGGAVIDYSWILAVFAAVCGGFVGAIVGWTLLREIESVIIGLVSTLVISLFAFLPRGNSNAGFPFQLVIFLLIITAVGSFAVSFLVRMFINKDYES